MLAIFAVFFPYSWMNAIHGWLGMGTLPPEPIVGYLARSTSAFYFMLGGLSWVISFDLRRLRPAVGFVGLFLLGFAPVLLGLDIIEGMPLLWTLGEGPMVAVMGAAILVLRRGVPDEPARAEDGG